MLKEEIVKNWKVYSGFLAGILVLLKFVSFLTSKKKLKINNPSRESLKDNVEINLNELVGNLSKIEKAKNLRFKLRRLVHTDRFVGDPIRMAIADEIFKEINDEKNQLSYSTLIILKERAENELGIQIEE